MFTVLCTIVEVGENGAAQPWPMINADNQGCGFLCTIVEVGENSAAQPWPMINADNQGCGLR